jgi:hypothetical protein
MFVSPPPNQRAKGSSHSSTRSHGLDQESSLGHLAPKGVGLLERALVHLVELRPREPAPEARRRREAAILVQNGLDALLCHGGPPAAPSIR